MVPQIKTEARTRRIFLRTPQRVITRPDVLPIWIRVSMLARVLFGRWTGQREKNIPKRRMPHSARTQRLRSE